MNAAFSNLPARRKTVQDICDARDKALGLYGAAHAGLIEADSAIAAALLAHHGASAGESRYNHHLKAERLHFHSRLNLEPRKDYMALATRLVDTDCWSHIIALTDLETLMDKKAKDEFNQQLLKEPPEFSFENVMATLETFMADAGTIWRRGIAECFSKLDRRFRSHDGWAIGGRDWYEWNPIHDWTTLQVFETIRADGQQPHPAYSQGNDRLSCVFCIMASKADLQNGARHNPKLYERFKAMEAKTGYTMHMSQKSLAELVEI